MVAPVTASKAMFLTTTSTKPVKQIVLSISGFFTCLDIDGSVFDDTKYVWLQSRQVWMLMRLYIDVERFHKKEILEAALKGKCYSRESFGLLKPRYDPINYRR